jgi:hypothetical protein
MDPSLIVPRRARVYILLQRTFYQSKTLSRLLRRLPGWLGFGCAQVETLLRAEYISKRFQKGILGDFNSIRSALPDETGAILDIGCGMAGIDVLLYRHYQPRFQTDLYLLDYEATSFRLRYGFSTDPAGYNSLAITDQFLSVNGVPAQCRHLLQPEALESLPMKGRFRIILSLLAWGFHFPVATYLPSTYELLASGGHLVLDIKKGTNGFDQLGSLFPRPRILVETPDYARVLVVKP